MWKIKWVVELHILKTIFCNLISKGEAAMLAAKRVVAPMRAALGNININTRFGWTCLLILSHLEKQIANQYNTYKIVDTEAKVSRPQRTFWSQPTLFPGDQIFCHSSYVAFLKTLHRQTSERELCSCTKENWEWGWEDGDVCCWGGDGSGWFLDHFFLHYNLQCTKWFHIRWLRLTMWSTLTLKMLAIPSWWVLVVLIKIYIFFPI